MTELLSKNEIIAAVQAALQKKDFNEESWKLIQRSTTKVLERCQQDFKGSAESAASRAASTLGKDLKDSLLALSSEFYEDVAEFDGAVLPQHCRYVRRQKGAVSMIIEQPPMVRTIHLPGGHYRLAMPYALFALNFQDRSLRNLFCGWRKKPMKSLEDTWGPICLPNMSENHTPCWGSTGFSVQGKTVAEIADEYITRYWSSAFNNDLNGYYLTFLKSNNLDGAAAWQTKSAKDPLWILKAEFAQGDKLGRYLTLGASKQDRRDHFLSSMTQQITTTVVKVTEEVLGLIREMDFERNNRPKYSQDELNSVVKEIILQAYAELCEYNDAVLARERVRLEEELASIIRDYEKKPSRRHDTW